MLGNHLLSADAVLCILFKMFTIHSDFQLIFLEMRLSEVQILLFLGDPSRKTCLLSAFWKRDVMALPAPAEHELKREKKKKKK